MPRMVAAVAGNVAELKPKPTLTDGGTVKRGLLLDSDTETPPAGAAMESVTVQVAMAPLPSVAGVQPTALTSKAVTSETVAVCEAPPSAALTVAG